ncbi:M24 family metallopeptidase [Fulvivirgaceae bacterium BMA10]|uniref:M24 family metallopeptidase n=1 Tax=Splendidivirga corallicola TaxID=3051826 RepID=A0ABT8KRP5_9BACT|nr:M24 family metallopeptidase [Fulvivirgaceae bacterium BMA10]
MTKRILFIILLIIYAIQLSAQDQVSKILPMRDRAEVIDNWLEERMREVLPVIMRRTGIDMWIIIAREYNEDPVIETMLPATWLAARRRTILVVFDRGEGKGLETLAIARYDVGKTFKKAWDKEKQPNQWARLVEIIEERRPSKIGVNKSGHFALADGISASEYEALMNALPKQHRSKVVSAERLALGWLETRSKSEMVVYPQICRIAHEIIAEGFSTKVIQPGITSTEDVMWWYRDRIRELKLTAWFHPTVSLQRGDPESFDHLRSFSKRPDKQIIMPGDLLHVDFGITYLRLNTDTQQHAYVLKAGEKDAPAYLKSALEKTNRLQDILTEQFQTKKTGNQILKDALSKAKQEGIKATIYTHPIGYHGHGAGPTIGLWDQQGGVPFKGDYPLYPNTAHSIELNAAFQIKEWNKEIRIMLEEDAFFDGETVRYIDGRQKEIILIPGS